MKNESTKIVQQFGKSNDLPVATLIVCANTSRSFHPDNEIDR